MLTGLFITLIILWFLGYLRIDGLMIPDLILFTINGQPITLWSILILLVISWAIGILPSPLRQIVAVFLIIWILAVLGIISLAGIPVASIVVLAIIVGMIFALLTPSDVV
jgi:hypothetical protein